MEKIKVDKAMIDLVEKFLVEHYGKHGDFGHDEINKFAIENNSDNGEIYTLLNHDTHVIVMRSGAHPGRPDLERFAFTEKGLLVYDFGSYREWEFYNDKRIQAIKESPSLPSNNFWASVIIGSATFITLLVTTIDSCRRNNNSCCSQKQTLQEKQETNIAQREFSELYERFPTTKKYY